MMTLEQDRPRSELLLAPEDDNYVDPVDLLTMGIKAGSVPPMTTAELVGRELFGLEPEEALVVIQRACLRGLPLGHIEHLKLTANIALAGGTLGYALQMTLQDLRDGRLGHEADI